MSIAANLAHIASVNAFAAAIVQRIANEESKSTLTDNKRIKFEKFARYVIQDKVSDLLVSVEYDANFPLSTKIEGKECDVYTVEKVANYLKLAFADDSVKESCVAMIKTVINCAKANELVTSDDFRVACSKDQKIDAKRKALICQNSAIQSLGTINSQHRSSYRALEALKVLKRKSASKTKIEFEIDTDNDVYKRLEAIFA